MEMLNAMLRNWRVIVLFPALLVVTVVTLTLLQDRRYVVSASFVPRAPDGGAQSSAAALAQQFGVSLGTDRPGQSPAFYVDLLTSRALLRQAVESQYQMPKEDGIWMGTLIQYWEFDKEMAPVPPWRKATEKLREDISASVTPETGVVDMSVVADHPLLAEEIADRLLYLLNQFNLENRRRRAEEEAEFISERLSEARTKLRSAESALETFLRQNREFRNSPELLFEHDRLQRQVAMRQEIYSSMLRSREQVRLDTLRETPLFTILDRPAGAAEPKGRNLVLRGLLAFILGLMLSIFAALLAEFIRRARETEAGEYEEFSALAREAWADLREPRRWLRTRN